MHVEEKLIESFKLVTRFFRENNIRHCLIGGLAAGFWGAPRYTQDMDFTVMSRSRDIKEIIDLFQANGFKIIEKGTSQFSVVQKGTLSFRSDLILSETDYQDLVVSRAIEISLFETPTYICTAEDLIILKMIANRRQDLLDIENTLQKNYPRLDKSYLKQWFEVWEVLELFSKEFKEYPL